MATVWIPSLLRELTGNQETVAVRGSNVGEVINSLEQVYPGVKARLCDANGLRPGMAVVVDRELARFGLFQSVAENSEVHFMPAISGG
jgi:molybdopterin synthase sulfur carrier subunit